MRCQKKGSEHRRRERGEEKWAAYARRVCVCARGFLVAFAFGEPWRAHHEQWSVAYLRAYAAPLVAAVAQKQDEYGGETEGLKEGRIVDNAQVPQHLLQA